MRTTGLLLTLLWMTGCQRTPPPAPTDAPVHAQPSEQPIPSAGSVTTATQPDLDAATMTEAALPPARGSIGPFEIPFEGKRPVYYVASRSTSKPQRLIANLHGVCNPPGYACGYWATAASEQGFLVCPTGNARCGAEAYNAPTWTVPFDRMGDDLEKAITTVMGQHEGEITRQGSILTGFSKGASAAAHIAQKHPGRWPYLILVEAAIPLDAAKLRKAGIRAVAMVAGERGSQIGPEKATVAMLTRQGFPARFWGMPGAGHWYSQNIDQIMREAMEFLLSHQVDPAEASRDGGS